MNYSTYTDRSRILITYLRTVYYLNVLVVLGAVLSNRMATRLSGVEPIHWATPIALALAVFIIYTVDRLLDVRKYEANAASQPLTNRHRFHHRHATVLWRVVFITAGLALILVFFLPSSVTLFGIGLATVCAVYVGLVFQLPNRHPALLLKEPLVALLYTAGVWGSVWVQRPTVSWVEVIECLMFGVVAFQNLLLFAVMEQYETVDQSLFSLATQWGPDRCALVVRWLTALLSDLR